MAVYIDHASIPYGRMKMSHMVADTIDELNDMADKIGVNRKWLQKKTGKYHYDVCLSKRRLAIKHGAIPVTSEEIIEICKEIEKDKQATATKRLEELHRWKEYFDWVERDTAQREQLFKYYGSV